MWLHRSSKILEHKFGSEKINPQRIKRGENWLFSCVLNLTYRPQKLNFKIQVMKFLKFSSEFELHTQTKIAMIKTTF